MPLTVFLLAGGIRYYRLGEAPVWVDEIFSWAVAHLRPSLLIGYLYQGNNPPLWELILSAWLKVTGDDSPFSLRFLPATFSALTVVGLYYLGRETGGAMAGTLAAVLWIFSTFAQGVCREARAYALLAFLSAVSFLFFTRYLKTQKPQFYWGWLVVSILLLHTHYSSFFVPLFQGVWLILASRRKAIPVLLRFGALLGLSLGPAALVFMDRALQYHSIGYAPFFSGESLYNLLWAFSNMPVPTVMALMVWGIGTVRFWRRGKVWEGGGKELPLVGLPLYMGLLVAIGWDKPLWQARYFVPLAVLYLWAVGTAVSVWWAWSRPFVMAGLAAAWIGTFQPNPHPPDPTLPQVARALGQKPNHQVLIVSPAYMLPALAYPLREKLFTSATLPTLAPEPLSRLSHELHYRFRLYGASTYAELPPCEILAQDTLYWLDMGVCFVDSDNILEELLLADFMPVALQRLGKTPITIYIRRR